MPEVIIRGDTPEEVLDLLRKLGSVPSSRFPVIAAEGAADGELPRFLASRSENQGKIIEALREAGGQLHLRELERQIDVTGLRLAGTLASLNRSGRTVLGYPVIEPGPWFVNDRGEWDREYRINTSFLNGTEEGGSEEA
ncbi:MAG TPA: hypothetical protein VGR43_02310 [Dehalococcoidia bacterium]|nr:hypothetical protein [Dehalococcoidia bacterium]